MVGRCAERRNDEHRKRGPRSSGATESSGPRSAHNEHPGSENASQGARREHHQRIANGLKFNVRPRKAASTQVQAGRGHALNNAGVTRSEATVLSLSLSTTEPFETGETVQATGRRIDKHVPPVPLSTLGPVETTSRLHRSFLFRRTVGTVLSVIEQTPKSTRTNNAGNERRERSTRTEY